MEAGRSVVHNKVIYYAPFDLGVIYHFPLENNSWKELEKPMKWFNSGLAIIEEQVVTIGGRNQNECTNEVWIWKGRDWERGKNMTKKRSDPGVLSGDSYVIVISGKGSAKYEAHWITSVEVYDVKSKRWNSVCPLPAPLGRVEVTLCNGTIYVFPDQFGKGVKCEQRGLILSRGKKRIWKTIRNCPLRYSSPTSVNNRVVCVGGTDVDGLGLEDIYVYESEDSWTLVGHLDGGRMYSMVEVCDNKIFVVGGVSILVEDRNPPNRIDTVDIYTLD